MQRRACLDAGTIHQHYIQDPPPKVENLFVDIENGKIHAIVPEQILVEVFKQLCVVRGKGYALKVINDIYANEYLEIRSLSKDLVAEAGRLKCQYRDIVSYNDAILIALAVQESAMLHTTEKNLPQIPGLKVVKYVFDA
nr:PIN domain-containing protein [Candidatus Sigynarchaeum springense]